MVLVVALLFGCIVFVGAAPRSDLEIRQLGVIPVTIYLNNTEGGTLTNNTSPSMQVYIQDTVGQTEYALVSTQIIPGTGGFSSRAALAAGGKPKGHDTRQPTFESGKKKSKKESLDEIEANDGDLLVVTAVGFGPNYNEPHHKTQVWTIKD
jgi:hypothetical protein